MSQRVEKSQMLFVLPKFMLFRFQRITRRQGGDSADVFIIRWGSRRRRQQS